VVLVSVWNEKIKGAFMMGVLCIQEAFPAAVHVPLVTARVRYANLAALLRQFFFTGDVLPYGEELHQLERALLNLHALLLDEGGAPAFGVLLACCLVWEYRARQGNVMDGGL
jgi:hypothetical protein